MLLGFGSLLLKFGCDDLEAETIHKVIVSNIGNVLIHATKFLLMLWSVSVTSLEILLFFFACHPGPHTNLICLRNIKLNWNGLN